MLLFSFQNLIDFKYQTELKHFQKRVSYWFYECNFQNSFNIIGLINLNVMFIKLPYCLFFLPSGGDGNSHLEMQNPLKYPR